MITAVIIDDEQKNILMLTALLADYCKEVAILGSANRAATGKKLIEKCNPQLIFLDIEMPFGSGFDLLRSMPDLLAEIIFVTAFDQYALDAFRYSALDYLLKPVNIPQLEAAVLRAKKRITEKDTVHNYELLLTNISEKDVLKKVIAFTDKGQQHLIQLGDIKYIIADGSYTHIYTVSRPFVATKSLKEFETMLPADSFCRIHHGHIINKNCLAKIQKGRGGRVIMNDGKELEIAIRRKEEFMKTIAK
jgi:two-component system, LytTR family, response regulator